jgi:hypothetical protein
MQNFDQSTYKNIDSNNIIVNLPNKDIYKNDITKINIDNNIKNYYEITYNADNPNFQSSLLNSNSYKSTKMYVFGLLHNNIINITNTSNTDIIGELVIEHKDNNNYNLYTCFLLKKNIDPNASANKTENPDKIDDIISYINNCVVSKNDNCVTKLTNVNLNTILSPSTSINNKFIYYKDKQNNNVIVFLTPINITYQEHSVFVSNLLNSTTLFNINPLDINTSGSNTNNITSNMDNANTEGDILDCELVGVGTENTPIDKLSINTLTNELNRNIDLMKIGIYFFALIVLIMITYSIVPYLFSLIINKSDNQTEDNKRISSTIIISTIFIVFYVFLLFHIGFKKNNVSLLFVGFIVVLIYILSILVIITQNKDFTFSLSYETFETLICECVKFTIKNVLPKYIGIFILTIVLIAIVLTIQKKDFKKTYGDTVVVWSIYIIPITIILSLVSHSPDNSTKSSCTK